VIFEKLSKVNNRPLGENSPNLVTLVCTQAATVFTKCDEKLMHVEVVLLQQVLCDTRRGLQECVPIVQTDVIFATFTTAAGTDFSTKIGSNTVGSCCCREK
jgi:hypothetical protein